mmetsp:Transcript_19914/g.32675  ORF Transcript_19914/g.32675 Transcript_19914/m.32675 type:complete len:295 (-) Transcript_19914:579-1463(-)|eukprot:CAMPEP_0184647444 /NCGR_PEP_ID=MMETSP0308-20130426/4380_1 /TAXON_ID=38269 /ORGANISM="Gloeochaete witrockiana, Strain SAG 46.84" /LENGTH=294 /DNA_ID=CAMNT_0027078413 /DNA_START=68 /DNA_END=952 /DNA_ORIENTATION=-
MRLILLFSIVAAIQGAVFNFDASKVSLGCKDLRNVNVDNVWEPLVLHHERTHEQFVPPYKFFQYLNAAKHVAGSEVVHFDFLAKNYPCPPGGVIVDGGANVAIYSVIYAFLGCKVLAFEPLTGDVAGLTLLVNAIDDKVCLVEAALSNASTPEAEMILNRKYPEGNWLQQDAESWLAENKYKWLGSQNPDAVVRRVPVVTLDDYLDSFESIHLLKLDLEGGEMSALEGAERTFQARKIHHMIVEVWKKPNVLEYISKHGFFMSQIKYGPGGYAFIPLPRTSWATYEGDVYCRLI